MPDGVVLNQHGAGKGIVPFATANLGVPQEVLDAGQHDVAHHGAAAAALPIPAWPTSLNAILPLPPLCSSASVSRVARRAMGAGFETTEGADPTVRPPFAPSRLLWMAGGQNE